VRNVTRVLRGTIDKDPDVATVATEPPAPKKGLKPDEEVALGRKKSREARGRITPKPTIIQLSGTRPCLPHKMKFRLYPRASCCQHSILVHHAVNQTENLLALLLHTGTPQQQHAQLLALSPEDRAACLAQMQPAERAARLSAMSPADRVSTLAFMSTDEKVATLLEMSITDRTATIAAMTPLDAATTLSQMPIRARGEVLAALAPDQAASILRLMSPQDRTTLLTVMAVESRAAAICAMSIQEQQAALAGLSTKDREATLAAMSPEQREALGLGESSSAPSGASPPSLGVERVHKACIKVTFDMVRWVERWKQKEAHGIPLEASTHELEVPEGGNAIRRLVSVELGPEDDCKEPFFLPASSGMPNSIHRSTEPVRGVECVNIDAR
jgi:flagellar motility protein MotE (MotC chaperone)